VNKVYRSVWNAALGACVAVAENVRAPRGGGARGARGARGTLCAHTVIAGAAMLVCGIAQAATFTVTNEADLITDIGLANNSLDPTSTITITTPFQITTQLPQIHANVALSSGVLAVGIGSVAGASVDVQPGASFQSKTIQLGIAAGTTGNLNVQGAGAVVSDTTLGTGVGQSTISVQDKASLTTSNVLIGTGGATGQTTINVLNGASMTVTNTLTTGAGIATINVGGGAAMSALNLNSGAGQTAINVTDGGTISLGVNANLGGTNATSNKGITNVVVSGTGSSLTSVNPSGYYHHNGTLEVSAGGFVGMNTVQLGFSSGDIFTGTVTGAGSFFGSLNNNLTIGGAGTATVTVADGARLSSGTNGTNPLTLAFLATGVSTLNIGAPVGSAPVAPGVVTASLINSTAGKSTVNFNHDASNYEFAVPIGGLIAVNQVGSGTTELTGTNTYSGGTNIAAGTLQLGNGGTTGSIFGNVTDNGTFAIDHKDAVSFTGAISGSGGFQQLGAGTTTLTGTNTYTGGTTVQAGTLTPGNANAFVQNTAYTVNGGTLNLGGFDLAASSFSGTGGTVALNAQTLTVDQAGDTAYAGAITGTGSLVKTGAGALTLSGSGSYTGATDVTGGTLRAGAVNTFSKASAFNVASGATLDLAGNSQTIASMTNAGTVSLMGNAPGATLTVTGPWVGNGGLLRLGTALGDSASVSDKLVLSGATAIASGTTSVQVTNLGGLGALTTGNGIQLISAINGATTTAQTTKDAFALAGGHVDAGAYQYRLFAGDASGTGEDWFLRSTVVVPPLLPPTAAPGTSGTVGDSVVPAYRAEVPMYGALGAQLHVSDLEMLGSMHQRMGDDTGAAATGQRQAWGRVVSVDRDIRQSGTASPESQGRRTGLQAGTDLWANTSWRAGVYVGQLDGDMNVFGFSSGIPGLAVGSNDLRSQYFGAYATWRNQGGFYVDTVLQSGRHRYTVQPGSSLSSEGKGSSLAASVELGQAFALAPGWQIEPELQLMHQHLSLDDNNIIGALIQQQGNDGWSARAGVRVKGEIATRAGTLQPYGSLNVYKTHGGADVTRFIGPGGFADIASGTGGTSTELAAGATWQLSTRTSVYGEVGKLWDQGGDERISSGLNASIGMKVLW
jgi:outer membrane autotransporter protein